jgi:hypothetical protein
VPETAGFIYKQRSQPVRLLVVRGERKPRADGHARIPTEDGSATRRASNQQVGICCRPAVIIAATDAGEIPMTDPELAAIATSGDCRGPRRAAR